MKEEYMGVLLAWYKQCGDSQDIKKNRAVPVSYLFLLNISMKAS